MNRRRKRNDRVNDPFLCVCVMIVLVSVVSMRVFVVHLLAYQYVYLFF